MLVLFAPPNAKWPIGYTKQTSVHLMSDSGRNNCFDQICRAATSAVMQSKVFFLLLPALLGEGKGPFFFSSETNSLFFSPLKLTSSKENNCSLTLLPGKDLGVEVLFWLLSPFSFPSEKMLKPQSYKCSQKLIF